MSEPDEDSPAYLCEAQDPVWGRLCQKDIDHTRWNTAGDRLHENNLPGDRIRWGSIEDMREAEATEQ